MEFAFTRVMGLRDGDSVVVRGMPVGKVKALHLNPDGVHVTASMDSPIEMRRGYKIRIVSTSMLGGQHVDVYQGEEQAESLPPYTVFRGEDPYDLMADAAELINGVKSGIIDGGVVENLRKASIDIQKVVERISAGKGTLGRLLSEDDKLYEDLAATVASARVLTAKLERGEGTLGRLLSGDDQLYQDLAATASSVRAMTGKLEKGEGALGHLLNDDELYEEIRQLVEEVSSTIDDYRETSPVATFTSIFFGAL
jgi:phospholipid/cholesterol/gamma-HCH transport system substrate-binding protein